MHNRLSALVATLAATLVIGLAQSGAAFEATDASSREMLLQPALHPGQSLVWSNQLTENGKPVLFVISCKVESQSAAGFVVLPSAAIGKTPLEALTFYRFTFRDGVGYGQDGKPLGSDPKCYFYSTPRFGIPPGTIHVGSSWQFSYGPDYHGSLAPNASGQTTVTQLDPAAKTLTLQVKYSGGGTVVHGTEESYRQSSGTLIVKIADGGVIIDEVIQKMRTVNKFHGLEISTDTAGHLILEKPGASL